MAQATFVGDLNADAVCTWAATIANAPDQTIRIDLNGVSAVRPCGIASLAAWIESLLRRPYTVTITAQQSPCLEHMQNTNLLSLSDIHTVDQFNRYPQGGRFARMARIDWQSDATKIARDLRDFLELEDTLAQDVFTCLEESIMNLWAHAGVPAGFAVAQFHERGTPRCWYELATVDCGKGIRAGLLENPDYSGSIPDDATALERACERGVTGAKYRYLHDQQHFGMGLFSIDQIAESAGGLFRLRSGSACRLRDRGVMQTTTTSFWQGTILSLRLEAAAMARPHKSRPGKGAIRFG